MNRVVIAVLLSLAGASALPSNASVEILRNPSHVTIIKPEPPQGVSNATAPATVNSTTTATVTSTTAATTVATNATEELHVETGNFTMFEEEHHEGFPDFGDHEIENIYVGDSDNTTDYNSTTPEQNCIRQDFENSAAAVFIPPVGALETALLIFNSSFEAPYFDHQLNATELTGLKLINQTEVECLPYYPPAVTRRLSAGALASLTG